MACWLISVNGAIKGYIATLEETVTAVNVLAKNLVVETKLKHPSYSVDIVEFAPGHVKVKCTNPGYLYNSRWTVYNIKYEQVTQLPIPEPVAVPTISVPEQKSEPVESGWFTWWTTSETVKASEPATPSEPVPPRGTEPPTAVSPVATLVEPTVATVAKDIAAAVETVVEIVAEAAVVNSAEQPAQVQPAADQAESVQIAAAAEPVQIAAAATKFAQARWGQKKKHQ